ncbi:hypothetical protein C1H46_027920 [Malus baccata]|uniref:Uncharacterized protein n=1 Tax=Malus baccata TaxID=106549 RepID=A0A540LJ74_MALBA|nr:hypothetical protein C1H46_027920 [Malus baccata]
MNLPQEIDDYIKESIDHSLGLPVSTHTLELKFRCCEEAKRRLQNQYSLLLSKLKEKEQVLERAKAEASMNAQALRKFVEENQRLASECAHLVTQCNKWERECSLYDHDREALMDFGNEADQRAKEAEIRVQKLEDEVRELRDELGLYKYKMEMHPVDSSAEDTAIEDKLLDSVLAILISKDEAVSARAFLEANKGNESCARLLKMWNCLKPSSQKVLSLVAEVKLLFEENKVLDVENKRLLRLYQKERNHSASGGKHTDSASAKSNKRKSSSKTSSPIQGKIDFSEQEAARQPLSPLRCNSPNSRTSKR